MLSLYVTKSDLIGSGRSLAPNRVRRYSYNLATYLYRTIIPRGPPPQKKMQTEEP